MGEKSKHRWQNDEYKAYMISRIKEKWNDKNHRKYMKKMKMEYWSDDKNRKAMSKVQKEINKCPIVRAKKANFGENNGMFGMTHTNEVKSRLAKYARERFKGKTYEELYGKNKAIELKAIRSIASKKWTENPVFGKNNPNAKPVHIKGRDFGFGKEAAIFYNKSPCTITSWLKTRDDCWYL